MKAIRFEVIHIAPTVLYKAHLPSGDPLTVEIFSSGDERRDHAYKWEITCDPLVDWRGDRYGYASEKEEALLMAGYELSRYLSARIG